MHDLPREERPTRIRWLIVLLLMGFTVQGHFNRISISVAGSERFIGPQGLTEEQMGFVYSAFLFVYTIGMLPGGWIIDRLGPRLALATMGLGLGLCVALTGVMGWMGLSVAALWLPLIAVRGLAGAASVPLHPGAAYCVSMWVPPGSRATANGLVTTGALLGIAASYPGFGWLMDRWGWPLAFVVCGAGLMLFALLWARLASDSAASHPWTNSAERRLVLDGASPPLRAPASVGDFFALFRNRGLVVLTLSYAALSYFQYLFFYWIERYFEKELELPVAASRRAAFTVTMAMAVGMTVGGVCSDWLCRQIGRRPGYRSVALVGMGLSALFAWAGISAQDPDWVVMLFSLALFSLGLCEGIFWTTAPLLQKRNGGLACAFLNTIGNAGGLLAPVCTPWINDHYGRTTAIAVACVVCGLGAVLWLGIDPDGEVEDQNPNA